jgi:hypothetical protein
MTLNEIKARLEDIRAIDDDNETAHRKEDQLYIDVLKFIASGACRDAPGYAYAALAAEKLKYVRWYA